MALSSALLSDLIFDKKTVLDVHSSKSVNEVLELLSMNRFQALPVYTSDPQGHKSYIGMVSYFDILTYVSLAKYFAENGAVDARAPVTAGEVVLGRVTAEAKNFWLLEPYTPLLKVIEYMSHGVHRVLTYHENKSQRQYVLVTQTDVIRFLKQHDDPCLAELWKRSLEGLRLANPCAAALSIVPVFAIENTVHAFAVLASRHHASAPVIDASGAIVSYIGADDLVEATNSKSNHLGKTVEEFLRGQNEGRLKHPITCDTKDDLDGILVRMIAAKVRVVYVVDSAMKPLAVVTFTDVLKCVHNAFTPK